MGKCFTALPNIVGGIFILSTLSFNSAANLLDTYEIQANTLIHLSSHSLLPPDLSSESKRFRGDTLSLAPSTPDHPNPQTIFTTTRGGNSEDRGWLSVFELDSNGYVVRIETATDVDGKTDGTRAGRIFRWQTPTSGGKANAIDLLAKSVHTPSSSDSNADTMALWILLTDDDDQAASPEGGQGVRVLEWDGWGGEGIKVVTAWPLPSASGELPMTAGEPMKGASHAIWLQ
jgi:carboxy-cis,cis-muconate cyclase